MSDFQRIFTIPLWAGFYHMMSCLAAYVQTACQAASSEVASGVVCPVHLAFCVGLVLQFL